MINFKFVLSYTPHRTILKGEIVYRGVPYLLIMLVTLCGYANEASYQNIFEMEQPEFLDCMFTDLNGHIRQITIPRIGIPDAIAHGIAFDGSSLPGMTTIKQSDMLLKPDMKTITMVPWTEAERKTARVICDIYRDERTPYHADARYFLQTALNQANQMGYVFFVGPELEFFICDDRYKDKDYKPCDTKNYCAYETNPYMVAFKRNLLNTLLLQNIPVEKIHHEVAAGQYEISLHYGNPLTIADQLLITKQTVRVIANLNSSSVTFMPKPFYGINGSGMHIHFSLWDIHTNQNLFYDSNDPTHLSPTAKHFIAGILTHISQVNAIFNASINSYKRLIPGFEAPTTICWGTTNRTALVRIPHIPHHHAARAEIRSTDALCNPYLVFGVLLKLGLDGIKNKIPLPEMADKHGYWKIDNATKQQTIPLLPSSLEAAVAQLIQSEFAKSLLGETVYTKFIECKKEEILHYNSNITNWELQEYFEC